MLFTLLLFLLFTCETTAVLEEESCESSETEAACGENSFSSIQELVRESNSLPALLAQDVERLALILDPFKDPTDVSLRDRFYHVTAMPLQTACGVGKRLGGQWISQCGFLDGDKYVCLDDFHEEKECLVYSFGIADDWSFEDTMGRLGCQVRAFDPTIDHPERRSENVTFYKLGLAHFTGHAHIKKSVAGNPKVTAPVTTLLEALDRLDGKDAEITYLKVDVEGSELQALPEWIESGVLKRVRQIGIEFHTGPIHLPADRANVVYRELLEVLAKMHKEDLGFRLISYTPNGCVGKSHDPSKKYYTYFDVVLYKPKPVKPQHP